MGFRLKLANSTRSTRSLCQIELRPVAALQDQGQPGPRDLLVFQEDVDMSPTVPRKVGLEECSRISVGHRLCAVLKHVWNLWLTSAVETRSIGGLRKDRGLRHTMRVST